MRRATQGAPIEIGRSCCLSFLNASPTSFRASAIDCTSRAPHRGSGLSVSANAGAPCDGRTAATAGRGDPP